MRKVALLLLAAAGVTSLALFAGRLAPSSSNASSHREAPLISEDPTADNTDLYAFRSPDKPSTFTIVSNWIPGEDPAAGPNYYTFSQSARYGIYLDTNGDGRAETTYYLRFKTPTGPFFLGNTVQSYTLTRNGTVVAKGQTPPDNIGPRTLATLYKTKKYASLAAKAVTPMKGGGLVFAGQRDDPFFADVGAIFDLLGFRKGTGDKGGGKDFLSGYNVHTIALQIPISQLHGKKIVGIWSGTDRRNVAVAGRVRRGWTQVSRLGNPLINEVIIPTGIKDLWNRVSPAQDGQFKKYYTKPILAAVMNKLYKLGVQEGNRSDLVAVLLTGIPKLNFTGNTPADELRLNVSVPVTPKAKVNNFGVVAGDLGGFPNGRRLADDVVDVEERAVAGFLLGKKVPLGDGVTKNDVANLDHFPYVGLPHSGYDNGKATS